MECSQAVTKYIRISPRKARLAAGLIRGLPVSEALSQLEFSPLRGSRLLKKTLISAIANAEMQLDIAKEKMIVMTVKIDCGPVLKRSKPKNRGGQHPILKRTSHFTVVVGR
ncbi:MAG: 50S ribosomal protein L22 [Chlamydiae bacterium]|nr:50S ribosomal protein L22 [Chlamydiota bacterium]